MPPGSPPARAVRRGLGTVLVAVLVATLAACGDDDTAAGVGDPEAQPSPDVSVFAEGDFGSIPLLPDSVAVGERTEAGDGTVVQSFLVPDRPPREVIAYYEELFDGTWDLAQRAEQIGPESWKAEWLFAGRRLSVTASPDPSSAEAVEGQQNILTQYSLHLHGES